MSSLRTHLLEENTASYNGSLHRVSSLTEPQIKDKLEWYFKTPYEKYNERGRKPFKLILQILKIVLITIQACLFAVDETSIVNFADDNLETFRNIFILDYDQGDKTKTLYSKQSVHDHLFYAWKQYYTYDDIMIGSYAPLKQNGSINPIRFCRDWYANKLELMKTTVSDLQEDRSVCYGLKPPIVPINKTKLNDFIARNNLPTSMGWILGMQMNFSFTTNYSSSKFIDCYRFDVKLNFDNYDLDGTMDLSLDNDVNFRKCNNQTRKIGRQNKRVFTWYSIIVVAICVVSMILCIRSFQRHYKLYQEAQLFFHEYRHEKLNFSDRLVFVSYWLVLIVCSDIFTISASIIKLVIDWFDYPELYWVCSIGFGIAVLLSWSGILRYLGYLKGYNVLLLTLNVSLPSIMRFIGCALFIYIGFVLCGWIVLGPYHSKFADLIKTCDCLYSLLNGDDMFNTFMLVENATPLILWFSKFYLYIFISLFIFVALSLFIGIVEDTFETINERGCAPKTRVQLFMEGKEYDDEDEDDEEG